MEWGPVEYARARETHVAYRSIVGDPDSDLVIIMINGYLYPMEVLPEDPVANRLIEGLASLGTLVMFDRRGIGLSDQITDWETHVRDQWVEDVAAVVDAVGRTSVSVFSWHVSGTGRVFAARHRECVDRLVLFNPYSVPRPEDRKWMAEMRQRAAALVAGDVEGTISNPNRRDDPTFRAWQDRAGRLGASPSQAARIWAAEFKPAPTGPVCVVPTLVITRRSPDDLVPAEFLARPATELPNAELVVLPDGDSFPIGAGVDAILAEISRFLVGEVRLPRPEREVRVIMFTDLVDSTRRAQRLVVMHVGSRCSIVTTRSVSGPPLTTVAASSSRPATACWLCVHRCQPQSTLHGTFSDDSMQTNCRSALVSMSVRSTTAATMCQAWRSTSRHG